MKASHISIDQIEADIKKGKLEILSQSSGIPDLEYSLTEFLGTPEAKKKSTPAMRLLAKNLFNQMKNAFKKKPSNATKVLKLSD